jgi:hypothetical protein
MGKPIDRKIPKSTPIMSYGKKKMRPEYWFSVPRNRWVLPRFVRRGDLGRRCRFIE